MRVLASVRPYPAQARYTCAICNIYRYTFICALTRRPVAIMWLACVGNVVNLAFMDCVRGVYVLLWRVRACTRGERPNKCSTCYSRISTWYVCACVCCVVRLCGQFECSRNLNWVMQTRLRYFGQRQCARACCMSRTFLALVCGGDPNGVFLIKYRAPSRLSVMQ